MSDEGRGMSEEGNALIDRVFKMAHEFGADTFPREDRPLAQWRMNRTMYESIIRAAQVPAARVERALEGWGKEGNTLVGLPVVCDDSVSDLIIEPFAPVPRPPEAP